jgi:hypothetical protein
MGRSKGWRKDYPYYKIQVFDPRSLAWIDEKPGFGSLDDTHRYAEERLTGKKWRIIIVEANGRRPLEEPSA